MKAAIVSLGGRSSKALARAGKKWFELVDELSLKLFEVHLKDGEHILTYGGEPLKEYDCVYIRGSYKYALIQKTIADFFKKKAFMPIAPKSFAIGHDKFLTLLELQKEGIPIPKTYYVPNKDLAKTLLDKVEYPIIIKVQEGTHGKGVMFAESKKSAVAILDILESIKRPYIIQEFVETKDTSDIRAIVCGDKVLASYKRIADKGDFRSNIHSGGKRQAHKITKEEEKIAIKSAKCLGINLCGVDILNSKHPSIIEVNLSPSMCGIAGVSEINVINEVVRNLYKQTVKFKEKQEKKLEHKLKKKEEKKEGKKNGNGKKLTPKKHKGNRGKNVMEEEEEAIKRTNPIFHF